MKFLRQIVFVTAMLVLAGVALYAREPVRVFVSILPQKYFVEQIAGGRALVSVMVGPGHNPAMYEPLPAQLMELAKAKLFFRIGVPFEESWLSRLASMNPGLKIIDTREGITLRPVERFGIAAGGEGGHDFHEGGMDPHIWLSPALVKIQARNIVKALSKADAAGRGVYESNCRAFIERLELLARDIRTALESVSLKKMLVFHPSWGYFADEFGLRQLPVEIEGKEPNPRELAGIISYAKANGIRVIFVQAQFNTSTAGAIAREVGGTVVSIDPLAGDYMKNMITIAETIAKHLQ